MGRRNYWGIRGWLGVIGMCVAVIAALLLPLSVLGHSGGSSVPSRPDVQETTSPVSITAPRAFAVYQDCKTSQEIRTSAYVLFGGDDDGGNDRPNGNFGLLQFNVKAGQVYGTYTEVRFSDSGKPYTPASPVCTTVRISGHVNAATQEAVLSVDGTDLRGKLRKDELAPGDDFRDALSPVVTSTWYRLSEVGFEKKIQAWGKEHPLKPCPAEPVTACNH